jgi:hypothetical protein
MEDEGGAVLFTPSGSLRCDAVRGVVNRVDLSRRKGVSGRTAPGSESHRWKVIMASVYGGLKERVGLSGAADAAKNVQERGSLKKNWTIT